MTLRIQTGVWKGTKVVLPEKPGLRPTPARVRETLANWLRPLQPLDGVLDLFAGSGILGLEVASLGAGESRITFVDTDRQLIDNIASLADKFALNEKITLCVEDALAFLQQTKTSYDLILLDPPYDYHHSKTIVLEVEKRLNPTNCYIYVEHKRSAEPQIPASWQLRKSTKAGNVRAHLWYCR